MLGWAKSHWSIQEQQKTERDGGGVWMTFLESWSYLQHRSASALQSLLLNGKYYTYRQVWIIMPPHPTVLISYVKIFTNSSQTTVTNKYTHRSLKSKYFSREQEDKPVRGKTFTKTFFGEGLFDLGIQFRVEQLPSTLKAMGCRSTVQRKRKKKKLKEC